MIKTCALFISLAIPATALAGNQWMMNKNAKELIEINDQLLNEIEPVANGKIHLEALVFSDQYQYNTIYKLEPVEQTDNSTPESSSMIFNKPAAKIRIGVINVGPNHSETLTTEADEPSQPMISGGKPLSSFGEDFFQQNYQLKSILNKHPNAKYLDLKGAGINIDFEQSPKWSDEPKYLIYW